MVVTPTNSLILLWPDELFSTRLQPLFKAHFANYGDLVLWTPLRKLGRVLVAYEDDESAIKARREMDGFVWDEASDDIQSDSEHEPMRVFFGPRLALPLRDLHSTLLDVPQLSRNFLISPPGSPPVGWEQTLEEAPNPNPFPVSSDQSSNGEDSGWAEELARALRFLSTDSNPEDDEVQAPADTDSTELEPSTTLLVSAAKSSSLPAVTVSSPSTLGVPSDGTGTPPLPPGAQKIGSVKATIESMLGRKRSFSDLRGSEQVLQEEEEDEPAARRVGTKILPTARPPLPSE
ncbi:hypothetical protein ACM66B_004751 [Microbotryomycetes sp. NB124-2]